MAIEVVPLNVHDPEEMQDWLGDVLSDSVDMDWSTTDGAKAIIREMEKEGIYFTRTPPASRKRMTWDDVWNMFNTRRDKDKGK